MRKKLTLKSLQEIPGVGPSIAKDLHDFGIRSVATLKGKNPERMYLDLCRKRGRHIDRCMLYVLRCAVYYSSHKKPNPNKLLWWNWKD